MSSTELGEEAFETADDANGDCRFGRGLNRCRTACWWSAGAPLEVGKVYVCTLR